MNAAVGADIADCGRQRPRMPLVAALLAAGCLLSGCAQPRLLTPGEQRPIDRRFVDYPSGFDLEPYIRGLTAPTAIAFDDHGSLIIAQGRRGKEVEIFRFAPGGHRVNIFPQKQQLVPGLPTPGFHMYGPVGGMLWHQGKIYVSHRDDKDLGVITALDDSGNHSTIVADLPAQGDFGVTDLALDPTSGRLFFGVGTATNSGVVGLDNWSGGWVRAHPKVHDIPWHDVTLRGYRFDTNNPLAGLLSGADIAVTAAFQAFNQSFQTRVPGADRSTTGNGRPNGAIYSVSINGGPPQVEAHGIRYPAGLAINRFGRVYMTNQGMEMRGTRPVKNDPDVMLRLVPGQPWFGWPDYTADLQPVSQDRFQPPPEMISRTGYPEVLFLIDHEASGLQPPDRDTLLQATFPSLSGASKLDFSPATGPFRELRGNALVCLSGDRAPFATSGQALVGPIGFKVVRVDVDTHQVRDFIRNVQGGPGSRLGYNPDLIERPIDVKFGPDGSLYILDFGKKVQKDEHEDVKSGSGKVYRLVPTPPPAALTATSQP